MANRILLWNSVNNEGILSKETPLGIFSVRITDKPDLGFNYVSFNYIEPNNGYDINGRLMPEPTKLTIAAYIDNYQIPVEWYKDIKTELVAERYNQIVYNIIGKVDASEMASWVSQENEARAYLLDNTISTPVLTGLAMYRNKNESIIELAYKVIGKADAYRGIYPIILGKYQYLQSLLENAVTIEDYLAIDENTLQL